MQDHNKPPDERMKQVAWGDWEPDPDGFEAELPALGPAGLERDGVLLLAIPIALLLTGWGIALQFALSHR